MSGGVARRVVVASGLLMLLVGAAFAVLLYSVADLRKSERLARHSQEVLATANQLERLVVDLETGQRGFVITGQRGSSSHGTLPRSPSPTGPGPWSGGSQTTRRSRTGPGTSPRT